MINKIDNQTSFGASLKLINKPSVYKGTGIPQVLWKSTDDKSDFIIKVVSDTFLKEKNEVVLNKKQTSIISKLINSLTHSKTTLTYNGKKVLKREDKVIKLENLINFDTDPNIEIRFI